VTGIIQIGSTTYPAKGDGIADDSPAFLKAIQINKAVEIHLQPGKKYLLRTPPDVSGPLRVCGHGAKIILQRPWKWEQKTTVAGGYSWIGPVAAGQAQVSMPMGAGVSLSPCVVGIFGDDPIDQDTGALYEEHYSGEMGVNGGPGREQITIDRPPPYDISQGAPVPFPHYLLSLPGPPSAALIEDVEIDYLPGLDHCFWFYHYSNVEMRNIRGRWPQLVTFAKSSNLSLRNVFGDTGRRLLTCHNARNVDVSNIDTTLGVDQSLIFFECPNENVRARNLRVSYREARRWIPGGSPGAPLISANHPQLVGIDIECFVNAPGELIYGYDTGGEELVCDPRIVFTHRAGLTDVGRKRGVERRAYPENPFGAEGAAA
jgi:hypothetical protein